MSINHVVYQGNLTRDPELRVTPNGTAVCSFSVAHNEKWKDDQGNQKERVCFLECVAWGKVGEMIAKWFAKGGQIMVEGKLEMSEWEDAETKKKRVAHKLNVSRPHFCGETGVDRKSAGQQQEQRQYAAPAQRQAPQQSSGRPIPPPREEDLDDSIPF